MALTLNLIGPPPWGFRLSGGKDFRRPIIVSKVLVGGKADLADLRVNDVILKINGESSAAMLNMEAQNKIRNSCMQLQLLVERKLEQTGRLKAPRRLTGHIQWSFHPDLEGKQNCSESPAHSPTSPWSAPSSPDPLVIPEQKSNTSTPSSNESAQLRPWSPTEMTPKTEESSSSFPYQRSSSMSSLTTTSPGSCSPHSNMARELVMPPKHILEEAMHMFSQSSEVYKMIQGNSKFHTTPQQSNTFRLLQEAMEAQERENAVRSLGRRSFGSQRLHPSQARDQKFHTCERCGNRILTQALQITDTRFRHAECFVCADCDLNLRLRSRFWVGDDVFCQRHARERQQRRASLPHLYAST